MILMYRSLQFILHLPIFNTVFPSNAFLFANNVISIIWFDVEYNFTFCDFITFLSYDDNKAIPAFVSN